MLRHKGLYHSDATTFHSGINSHVEIIWKDRNLGQRPDSACMSDLEIRAPHFVHPQPIKETTSG